MAISKRNHNIELLFISSLTLGTVILRSFDEKGSYPAIKAEVSRTMAWAPSLVFISFFSSHSFEK
jgi:hypothetical protein